MGEKFKIRGYEYPAYYVVIPYNLLLIVQLQLIRCKLKTATQHSGN